MYFVILYFSSQMPEIKLQSSDGEIYDVDVEVAKASVTIKTMLEGEWMGERECLLLTFKLSFLEQTVTCFYCW